MTSVTRLTRKERFIRALKRDKYLYLLFLPIFVWYIVFCYTPLGGLIIAFKDFKPGMGIYGGDWVGMRWFIQFFQSPFAYRLIRNTVLISLYSLIYGFPVPILFAICITELRHNGVRRVVQTVSYLPHFISTVVVVGMIKNFLSMNDGLINNLIALLGGTRVNFLTTARYFRTIYVASGVWQGFGYGAIIYIAAIMGIDPSLYESARIDGISKFQEVRYITIPMIAPTIIILFIMQLGRLMNVGFEKVFLLYSSGVYETSDVISTYVYRKGIESNAYSFSTAVGLFNTCINFLFVFGANQLSRRITDTSLW